MKSRLLLSVSLYVLSLVVPARAAAPQITRVAPRSPEETLKSLVLRPGFKAELVAAEPLLRSPVAIDFDADGRLYVAQYPEYNDFAATRPHGHGAITRLEDRDGDGRYEHSVAFADDIPYATGVLAYGQGVLVTAVPDILYLADTDGDGKADIRRRLFTGFQRDHAGEAMFNSLRWGLDNRVHLTTGMSGGLIQRVDRPQEKPVSIRNLGMAFDPRTLDWTITGGGGQYGMAMDDWGRKFACSNSMPAWQVMYDSHYLLANPTVVAPASVVAISKWDEKSTLFRLSKPEAWREIREAQRDRRIASGTAPKRANQSFTSCSGLLIYRGDAFPESHRGSLFVGEVANNLVYRARLEPAGQAMKAVRADPGAEFIASADNWFRPAQIAPGPDGCLYLVDMYRELIEGAEFMSDDLLKQVDPSGGVDRGRIYRIVPEGFKRPPLPRLSRATTPELVAQLESRDGWHRDTAARLLAERRDPAAAEPLGKLAGQSTAPTARMHALYALATLDAAKPADVLRALGDDSPDVRRHALIVAERFGGDGEVAQRLASLVRDPDREVREQLAFSLAAFRQSPATDALVQLALTGTTDNYLRLGVLCSAAGQSAALVDRLLAETAFRQGTAGLAFILQLVEQIAVGRDAKELDRLLATIERLDGEDQPLARNMLKRLMMSRPRQRAPLALSGRNQKAWQTVLASQRQAALDRQQTPATRAAAVHVVSLLPWKESRGVFEQLLAAGEAEPVQLAAATQVGKYSEPDVAPLVLAAWPGLGPGVRSAAIEVLLARPAWAKTLLDAIERGDVARAEVDAGRVQLLQAFPDADVRRRAAEVFRATQDEARAEVFVKFRPALSMHGDVAAGQALFRKQCTACHRLDNEGRTLGADLAAIGSRASEAVLLNILDPNREVKPRYLVYVVVTSDGHVYTGPISSETATSITLDQADGSHRTVLRSDIEELRNTGRSFMPEGLEKLFDLKSMADLLAYLGTKK